MEFDYQLAYEVEKSRRIALESRLRSIYVSPILRLFRNSDSIKQRLFGAPTSDKQNLVRNKSQKLLNQLQAESFLEFNNSDSTSSKFAVIAQWSTEVSLSHSCNSLIRSLLSAGFEVVLVSASPSEDLYIEPELASRIALIRKPNIGYDFGSWLAALLLMPEISNKSEIILTNDSLIGPFIDLSNPIEKMRVSAFDITSLTDCNKYAYHLQSYFLHFKNRSFASESIQNFFRNLEVLEFKAEFVLNYEIEFTRTAQASGLLTGALFPWNAICKSWENPTIDKATTMLDGQFPFIKREYLRMANTSEVNHSIEVLTAKYEKSESFRQEITQLYLP